MTEKITDDPISRDKRRHGACSKIWEYPDIGAFLDIVSDAKLSKSKPGILDGYLNKWKWIKRRPVVIVAGGTEKMGGENVLKYRTLLIEGFQDFTGTIISGGTTAGVCGLVGEVQVIHKDTITTIGYLPLVIPETVQIDLRYHDIRKTDGQKFSERESYQYWADILFSGILASEVKLIGINGGTLSAAEYRIALCLGAKVVVIQDSGRAVTDLLADKDWNTFKNLIILPNDGATLREFIGSGTSLKK